MLLKKMNLENFRQFIGTQSIDFSTEPDRNVTIILGENGSGKTTLAQAFTCVESTNIWLVSTSLYFIHSSRILEKICSKRSVSLKRRV